MQEYDSDEYDDHEEFERPQINALLVLGPPSIGKKYFILALAEKYPNLFHIVRTLTTKAHATIKDRIFFDQISEPAFFHARDKHDGVFWWHYERVKPDTKDEEFAKTKTFLFGSPGSEIVQIPGGMYGLIGVSSWAQYTAFFEYLNKEELMEVQPSSIQLLSDPSVDSHEDVLSMKLRAKGLEEQEISKQIGLSQLLEKSGKGNVDARVLLTGNDEVDVIQICDAIRSLGIELEYK